MPNNFAPIAIVGIGLRLPGNANDTSSFWDLLCAGTDAISEIPEDRWNISKFYDPTPGTPGKTYSKWGGFIDGYDQFDPALFNISAKEADTMDPQQRLLLEAAWHAMEDSGEVIDRQSGVNRGVFVGVCTNDYETIGTSLTDFGSSTAYSATGSASSIAANRISHAMNFKGPSVSFDTACSSSLVALHYACQSLQNEECDSALVGGVNFIINPSTWVGFCGMSALSKDGRCKSFDASADGFVRSEGVGVVLLKPLSQAIKDGNRVYACIRGTGCNQDGHTPAISMPDQQAQEALIAQTLDRAGIAPHEVSYIEAHGTGTAVGDPIEARAIGNAFGIGRSSENPLLMGSVKSNIGHLEAGAGIAGIIKSALMLWHREVPKNLHFKEGNPVIPFESLKLKIPTERQTLSSPNADGSIYACINSFGFGGTNSHAILESYESAAEPVAPASEASGPFLLSISAQSEKSLNQLVEDYVHLIATKADQFATICQQSISNRVLLKHRLMFQGADKEELVLAMADYFADKPNPQAVAGLAQKVENDAIVFVFSGQGSQWYAMGRELYVTNPTFKKKIEEIDALIRDLDGFNLIEELLRDEEDSQIQKTEIAQPAIFAVQVGLAAVWSERGITPAAVVGHSVGEVAAAHVAGALSLKEAVRVIFHRGDTMKFAEGGKMIAVGIDQQEAEAAIAAYGDRLSLAAVNSPTSVSISGEPEALAEIFPKFEAQGVFCRYVPVEYAFHSAQMNPVKDAIIPRLDKLEVESPKLPIYSTVTGSLCPGGFQFDAEYWWHNVRESVRFADAIKSLLDDGYRGFLELSSHPVLNPSLKQCIAASEVTASLVGFSLHKTQRSEHSLFAALANFRNAGHRVNLPIETSATTQPSLLPLYPFDRESYWNESHQWNFSRQDAVNHPYLLFKTRDVETSWHFWPETKQFPYLQDHMVGTNVIVPAAGFVEMALAIGHELIGDDKFVFEEIEFKQALLLPEEKSAPAIRTSYNEKTSSFQIHSCFDPEFSSWVLHAEGGLRVSNKKISIAPNQLSDAKARCSTTISPEDFYQSFTEVELYYGPFFQGVKELTAGDNEVVANIELYEEASRTADPYFLHPALLDSCFQTILAAIPEDYRAALHSPFLPVWINRMRFFKKAGNHVEVHTRLLSLNEHELEANLTLYDVTGEPVALIEGFKCQKIAISHNSNSKKNEPQFFSTDWKRVALRRDTDLSTPQSFFPKCQQVTENVRTKLLEEERSIFPNEQLSRQDGLQALALSNLVVAFKELGFDYSVGRSFSWNTLIEETGIIRAYHKMIKNHLRDFVDEGFIKEAGANEWTILKEFSTEERALAVKSWLIDYPAGTNELSMCMNVGEILSQVLCGKLEPAQALFGKDNSSFLECTYTNSISALMTNHAVKEALVQLTKDLPQGRRLRILEIGGGTAATAQNYLPALPTDSYELTFTDVSEAFFSSAEQKLSAYPNVKYQKLDISKDPSLQGFEQAYDIIIAVHVVHATPHVRETLKNIRSLLRPNGYFALVDLNDTLPRYVDMLFGLMPGWWEFKDLDLRPEHCTLPAKQWTQLLNEAGFTTAAHIPDRAPRNTPSSNVFISQATDAEEFISLPGLTQEPGDWIILSGKTPITSELIKQLEVAKHRPHLITTSDWDRSPQSLITQAKAFENYKGIIYLGALDTPYADHTTLTTAELEESQEWSVHVPRSIIQAFANEQTLASSSSIWMVTQNAIKVLEGDKPNVAQSPLHGMTRVAFNELREVAIRLVDLSTEATAGEVALLVDELLYTKQEDLRKIDQVSFRGEGRYLEVLQKALPTAPSAKQAQPLHDSPCRVTSTRFGALDALCLETIERRDPQAEEVEVKIHAVGLNFRDVMKALRIYPTTIGDAQLLGDEFSGEVVRVGTGVTKFKVGDRIAGASMGTFRTHWTGSYENLCRLPESYSYEEGATFITAYMTGFHALHTIGRMAPGERVLIHSALGGVGFAAVRLAQAAGAEVFATAGTASKRTLLQQMGVKNIYNSRNLDFAEEIMETTNGEGIDIVLNALAGEAIPKSLKCLRQGGRFLEIGKRDIYENTRLGLRPFMNGLSFSSIDLAAGMQAGANRSRMENLEMLLDDGTIQPLPFMLFPFSQPHRAFRQMTEGKHIGKLVLRVAEQHGHPIPAVKSGQPVYNENQTVLISGGTSGLGLAMAQWFIQQGARHIVLVSRSGQKPGNEALEQFLAGTDANVIVKAADIADESAVKLLLSEIRKELPPLSIIVHSAFVLADELFLRMTREHFVTAMQAKVSGAWNLHRHTQQDPIEQFIVFSSMASIMGNSAQSNYVAANIFLEQLIHNRIAHNQAGLVVNLDMINDTGFVARNEKVSTYLQRSGWTGMASKEVIDCIATLINNQAQAIAVTNTSITTINKASPGLKALYRFQELLGESAEDNSSNQSGLIRQEIQNAPQEQKLSVIEAFLTEQVAKVLRVSSNTIVKDVPLNQQGIDSLMAVELVSLLEGKLAITIPTSKMMNAPTVTALSELMLGLIDERSGGAAKKQAVSHAPKATVDPTKLPSLSENQSPDDDLQQLLPYVTAEDLKFGKPLQPKQVLLTGANGFLGVYLLRDILQQTNAHVTCLIREKDAAAAAKKLRKGWERYQLDTTLLDQNQDRWSVVCGDLSKPQLALAAGEHQALCKTIDTILHCGAEVSHVNTYHNLRDANVLGTIELIRIAGTGKAKHLHFASSIALYSATASVKTEAQLPDAFDDILEGYGQSKAVCELLLNAAKAKGLATTSYRIGPVIGDGVSGISASHDFVWVLLAACVHLGAAPDSDLNLYLTPVDLASRTIATAMAYQSSIKNCHVLNTSPVTFNYMVDGLKRAGYPIETISVPDWIKRVNESEFKLAIKAYFAFRENTVEDIAQNLTSLTLNHEELDKIMKLGGIEAVTMDASKIDFYVNFLMKSGALPDQPKLAL